MKKTPFLRLSKTLVLIFMSLTFINTLLPDEFLIGIHILTYKHNEFQMIIRWFNFVSFLVLPIAVYYDKKVFKKIAVYFCLPVALIFLFMYNNLIYYYTSDLGTGISDIRYLPDVVRNLMYDKAVRSIIFFTTSITQILTILIIIKRDPNALKFKKNEIIPFVILIPLLTFLILPPYALEGIFHSYSNVMFTVFSTAHIVWILSVFFEIVILTLLFKNRSYEDRYILVLLLALSLFVQYNQLFSSLGELTCKRMPFQLCNIAAYLILVSIITKNRDLFLFNILINVAGGLIALFVMDVENNGILNKANIHYIVEHHNVIITPLLCLILGIFKPITNKDFKRFVLYFSGYFIFVFVLGTTFNAIYKATESSYFYANYLFLFDQDVAARLLPFAGSLFNFKICIGSVTIYPIVQSLIYMAFFLIGTLTFFILKTAVREKNTNLA